MEELYKKHEKLIRAIAGQVSRSTKIEYDEAFDHAKLIFVECCHRWNHHKSKGAKFSTYLSQSLIFALFKFARENGAFNEVPTSGGESWTPHCLYYTRNDNFSDSILLKMTLESLDRDARQCVELAFDPPDALMQLIQRNDSTVWSKKVTGKVIKKYLHQNGWTHSRIKQAFNEVRTAIA
jgi:hypothetical protein